MRQLIDKSGTSWDVFEVSTGIMSAGRADYLPAAFRAGWLVFDCGKERRRLAPFPGEWAGMSNAALCSLLDAAEIVPRSRRSAGHAAPFLIQAPPGEEKELR